MTKTSNNYLRLYDNLITYAEFIFANYNEQWAKLMAQKLILRKISSLKVWLWQRPNKRDVEDSLHGFIMNLFQRVKKAVFATNIFQNILHEIAS